MGAIIKSRRNVTARALLKVYEAKDILREDQKLFHKTIADLKSKVDSISVEDKERRSGSD
jgi:hypothetical protein